MVKVASIRSDVDHYVMPRVVTAREVSDLREYLSHHEPHSVTVKVNPLDPEATEYASQLKNALTAGTWDAEFSTFDGEPRTSNDGLCILEHGVNSKPNDPKHDPLPLLQQGLSAAHIAANCGGSVGAGDYKLYLLVGHRPISIHNDPPVLFRLGRWLMGLGR